MLQAGVRNLKEHLSEYLRRVRESERILITDRGRPIAALVGVDDDRADELASTLVRQGIGDWGGGKPRGLQDAPRVPGRRGEEVVIEDRR